MTRRRLAPIALLAATLSFSLSTGQAQAQNASEQAEARTLFNEGAHLFTAGQYAAACTKLEASYHLYAGIGTRGKLAECYEKVGRTASAWAMYEEVAALAGKAGDGVRQRVANERAAALEPALSHLTIVVPPANDVAGLVVKRAGAVVESGAIGSPIAVDPGPQSFEVSAPGFVSQTVDAQVPAGQAFTFTVPALVAAAPAAQSAVVPSAPSEHVGDGEGSSPRAWQRPAAIAIAGTGMVAAVVGTAVALSAKSSYSGEFDSGACSRATLTCSPTGQQEIDSARSRANAGGVVLALGAAMIVGGGVLFFLSPHASKQAASGVRITPDVGPKAASLSLAGSF